MPSNLKSQPTAAVAQAATTCLTAGATATLTLVGLTMANTSATPQKGTARLKRGGTSYHIIKDGPIPNGNTLCPVGENGKVILMPNDILECFCDTGTMDVIASYLEQTP